MFGLFGGPAFEPAKISDLAGKVIVITGANAGLGYESLLQLAPHRPSKIYLCARSKAKYEVAMKGIVEKVPDAADLVQYLELDLASLASVKDAAERLVQENDRLDILMNNAGVMALPPGLTKDGYEIQFGTNHLGHFLFTKKLLPLLQATAEKPDSDVRIINVSSMGHKLAPSDGGFIPETCRTTMADYNTFTRYGQSKLANILLTNQLAKRHPNITSVSVHPGGVATNLADTFSKSWILPEFIGVFLQRLLQRILFMTPDQGALTQTWAAVGPLRGRPNTGSGSSREVEQGKYYVPTAQEATPSRYALDEALSNRLWQWSDKEVQRHGY